MVLSLKPPVEFSSGGGKGTRLDGGGTKVATGQRVISPPTTVPLAGSGSTGQGHVPRFVQTGTTFPSMFFFLTEHFLLCFGCSPPCSTGLED
jgi:hypothetical protein